MAELDDLKTLGYDAVKAFQMDQSLKPDGVAGPITRAALADALRVKDILVGFRGSIKIVHDFEGHNGKAYWPGGESGITLDPGYDIGHADMGLFRRLYERIITAEQMQACMRLSGMKGEVASAALKHSPVMQSIRISREQAHTAFPHCAKPYWSAISKRFQILQGGTPGPVHTVFLSLAYNRGPGNKGLDVLVGPVSRKDWKAVADLIAAMQQNHALQGIRDRRVLEANLIRAV